jgi:hypothetical protein
MKLYCHCVTTYREARQTSTHDTLCEGDNPDPGDSVPLRPPSRSLMADPHTHPRSPYSSSQWILNNHGFTSDGKQGCADAPLPVTGALKLSFYRQDKGLSDRYAWGSWNGSSEGSSCSAHLPWHSCTFLRVRDTVVVVIVIGDSRDRHPQRVVVVVVVVVLCMRSNYIVIVIIRFWNHLQEARVRRVEAFRRAAETTMEKKARHLPVVSLDSWFLLLHRKSFDIAARTHTRAGVLPPQTVCCRK